LDCIVGPFENLGDLLIVGEVGHCSEMLIALAFLIGGDGLTEAMGVDSLI